MARKKRKFADGGLTGQIEENQRNLGTNMLRGAIGSFGTADELGQKYLGGYKPSAPTPAPINYSDDFGREGIDRPKPAIDAPAAPPPPPAAVGRQNPAQKTARSQSTALGDGNVVDSRALNQARDADWGALDTSYQNASRNGDTDFAHGQAPSWTSGGGFSPSEVAVINSHIRGGNDSSPHAIYGGGQQPSGPAFSYVDQLARMQAIDPDRYGGQQAGGSKIPELDMSDWGSLIKSAANRKAALRQQEMGTQMGIARANNASAANVAGINNRGALDVAGVHGQNALDVENLRGEHGYRTAALSHDPNLSAAQAEEARQRGQYFGAHAGVMQGQALKQDMINDAQTVVNNPGKYKDKPNVVARAQAFLDQATNEKIRAGTALEQAKANAMFGNNGVEGMAEGGIVGRTIPQYGEAPQPQNPLLSQYGQYLHAAAQAGVPPVPFPHYVGLMHTAQQQLQAAPPPGFADGGRVPGYTYGGFMDYMGEVKNKIGEYGHAIQNFPQTVGQALVPRLGAYNQAQSATINNLDRTPQAAPAPAPAAPPDWAPTQQQLQENQRITTPYNQSGPIRGYAQGGGIPVAGRRLEGAGTGTSDSLPAVIDGQHPAALSRGEFVIPAHVVRAKGTEFFDKLIAQCGEQKNV